MGEKHRVIIYESSSFGGNCRYAHELSLAYAQNADYETVHLVLPRNSNSESNFSKKILMNDIPQGNLLFVRFHFLLRSFINPFIFLFWLISRPSSLVIFNDFEQLFSPIWVPLYKLFLRKHHFCIFLHDPDRDAYPPNLFFSSLSMKTLLWLCPTALYHQHLPAKPYYTNKSVSFLSVPHGIYTQPKSDVAFSNYLKGLKGERILLSILGNIRFEKNYHQAIRCLPHLPDCLLLIAGKPANSSIDIDLMKQYANEHRVSDRIIWHISYMSESQLSAAIEITDICLLNYLPSFASQSGMINMYAPYRKKLVISDTESGLASLNREYRIGAFCDPLNDASFVQAVELITVTDVTQSWSDYLLFASWDRQVSIVTQTVFSASKN